MTVYFKKPCRQAGLLLLVALLLTCAGKSEEIESSVNIYPEELGPGLQRTVKFIKQADKAAENCSKKVNNYNIEGFRITSEKIVCYVDTVKASKVNKSLSPESAFIAITKAVAEWTSSVRHMPVLQCYKSTTPVLVSFDFDGRNTVSWQNLSLFTKDTLGAVNLIVDTENNRLVEFDIALNEAAAWSALESAVGLAAQYDIQSAMATAFGYVYGLSNVDKDEDCGLVMYPYVAAGGTAKRRLGAGDIAGLGKIYKKRLR